MKCDVCSANVIELRRGRCWGCYNRWVENRPVGVGAQCCVCGERRREFLRTSELLGGWWPTCYSCSGRIHGLEMVPQSIAEIREVLDRERRGKKPDRRAGNADGRVFQYDRRHGERRLPESQRRVWPSMYNEGESLGVPGSAHDLAASEEAPGALEGGDGAQLAEGTEPGREVKMPMDSKGSAEGSAEIDDLALSEIAIEIAQTGDYDPDLTCIRDLGWTSGSSHAASPLDGAVDLLDI